MQCGDCCGRGRFDLVCHDEDEFGCAVSTGEHRRRPFRFCLGRERFDIYWDLIEQASAADVNCGSVDQGAYTRSGDVLELIDSEQRIGRLGDGLGDGMLRSSLD